MDTAVYNGEFTLDSRGMPYSITGLAELLQRVYISLKVKRGSFIYSRNLGCEPGDVHQAEDALHSRAELLAREATADIPQAALSNLRASVTVDEKIKISFDISLRGESGSVEVII